MGSRSHSSTCSAGPPAQDAPGRARRGGSVPRGPGPWRWSSLGARAVEYSPGGRGGRSARVAPRTEGCGDAGCAGSCPRDASLVLGALLPAAPRGTESGGSESRPRPGQWQSAELAALPLLFLRREARSRGGWVGAEGRGGGRAGPRGAAAARRGLRRSRVRACGPGRPLSRSRAKGWDPRWRGRGKRARATVNAELF